MPAIESTGAAEPLAVAVNRLPVNSSWGGGNQWVRQMVDQSRSQGLDIRFDLNGRVDWIVLMDPRPARNEAFSLEQIRRYKSRYPSARCLHRINENDLRKATQGMDAMLAEANQLADHTVFLSNWLLDYHASRWFDKLKPHSVILNGADSRIFNPDGASEWKRGEPMRLVTHHWSSHWMKGFDVYQQVDNLIAEGQLPGFELWIIGRWPAELRWRKARTFGPHQGRSLAKLLKRCHVYITASRSEPGGMHIFEALQCGLPVLYHPGGGGIVEAVRPYGVELQENLCGTLSKARAEYPELRLRAKQYNETGSMMCQRYASVMRAGRNAQSHA